MAQENMWQQIAAPQIWGATDGYREMGNLFGAANNSIQGSLDALKNNQVGQTSSELLRRVSSIGDPELVRQALSNGSLTNGLNLKNISPEAYNTINTLGSSYLTNQHQGLVNEDAQNSNDYAGYLRDNPSLVNQALTTGNMNGITRGDALANLNKAYNENNTTNINNAHTRATTDSLNFSNQKDETDYQNNLLLQQVEAGAGKYGSNADKLNYYKDALDKVGNTNPIVANALRTRLNSMTDPTLNGGTATTPDASTLDLSDTSNPVSNSVKDVSRLTAGKGYDVSDLKQGATVQDLIDHQGKFIHNQNTSSNPVNINMGKDGVVKATSAIGHLQLTRAALQDAIKLDPSLANKEWNTNTIQQIGTNFVNHAKSLNQGQSDTSKGDRYLKMLWGENIKAGDSGKNTQDLLNKISNHESSSNLFDSGTNNNNTSSPKLLKDEYSNITGSHNSAINNFNTNSNSRYKTVSSFDNTPVKDDIDLANKLKSKFGANDSDANAMIKYVHNNFGNVPLNVAYNAITNSLGGGMLTSKSLGKYNISKEALGKNINYYNSNKFVNDKNTYDKANSLKDTLVSNYNTYNQAAKALSDNSSLASLSGDEAAKAFNLKKRAYNQASIAYQNSLSDFNKHIAQLNNIPSVDSFQPNPKTADGASSIKDILTQFNKVAMPNWHKNDKG